MRPVSNGQRERERERERERKRGRKEIENEREIEIETEDIDGFIEEKAKGQIFQKNKTSNFNTRRKSTSIGTLVYIHKLHEDQTPIKLYSKRTLLLT